MSDWMWFVVIILGMILAAVVITKWIDAKVQIETILAEEVGNDDDKNNSEDS